QMARPGTQECPAPSTWDAAAYRWSNESCQSRFPFSCVIRCGARCFEQTKEWYGTGQARDSRARGSPSSATAVNCLYAHHPSDRTRRDGIGVWLRRAVAHDWGGHRRPGGNRTGSAFYHFWHRPDRTHRPSGRSIGRLEARLYAPDGHRLTEIVGGVTMDLRFNPESLATSAPVPREPLERIVTALAPAGTAGTQMVDLFFPSAPSKTFGPFHVQVERGGPANPEFRLFDAFNTDL